MALLPLLKEILRKVDQCLAGYRQWPQTSIESVHSDEEQDVVSNRPLQTKSASPASCLDGIRVILASDHDRTHRVVLTSLESAPEPRQSDQNAEAVNDDTGEKRAGADVDKGCKPAKHGGESELE